MRNVAWSLHPLVDKWKLLHELRLRGTELVRAGIAQSKFAVLDAFNDVIDLVGR